jgi:DNA-directed RNA polymerase subunit RPC12/RpoP
LHLGKKKMPNDDPELVAKVFEREGALTFMCAKCNGDCTVDFARKKGTPYLEIHCTTCGSPRWLKLRNSGKGFHLKT